ncbi:MAG TPA: Lrp/AsnC family transcriptional regulator [Actinomycetota bacterium]|jgi:Lrp/AsnC family leucine-responsive transcriptional regulator|nr:Lrp/AsnC family transcriptional regulator [Actinomycetota bacterium]
MARNLSSNGPDAFGPSKALDDTGWAILRELQGNARISFSELGRRVSLTPPAVAERVRRMEEAGLITGYRVQVAMDQVGYPISAFVRMRARGERGCAILGDFVKEVPEVVEAHRVTGEDSYIVKVVVQSVQHLQELIDRLMPYGETVTALVLSSPVTHRVLGDPREAVTEESAPADRVTA